MLERAIAVSVLAATLVVPASAGIVRSVKPADPAGPARASRDLQSGVEQPPETMFFDPLPALPVVLGHLRIAAELGPEARASSGWDQAYRDHLGVRGDRLVTVEDALIRAARFGDGSALYLGGHTLPADDRERPRAWLRAMPIELGPHWRECRFVIGVVPDALRGLRLLDVVGIDADEMWFRADRGSGKEFLVAARYELQVDPDEVGPSDGGVPGEAGLRDGNVRIETAYTGTDSRSGTCETGIEVEILGPRTPD